MDETVNNMEERQDAPLAPEISDWEPSAPPEDGSPPDYYTALKLSDVPSDIPPPPEYSPPSIQGTWTGEVAQESAVSSLAYADFLPRCLKSGTSVHAPVFDNFKSLIGFANQWLKNNRQYKVLRCESITRKIKDGQIEMDSTAFHQSLYGENDYVRGLRIWLIPAQSTTNEEPQEIAYLNIVPKDLPPKTIPLYMASVRVGAFGMGGTPMAMGATGFIPIMFPDFEDLQKTCERFNNWVRQYPLPGKMLNLDSLDMIHSEAWTSRCLDPDEGFLRERGKTSKLYVTVLRLFYVLGKPVNEELDFEDFNPEIVLVSKVQGAKPRYEPHKTVLKKAGTWLYNQNLQDVRVMNVNTIDTKVDSNEFRRLSDRFRIDSNKSFYNDPSYKSLTFVKTIRVCFVRTTSMKVSLGSGPVMLTSKCIIAARLGGNNVTESLSSLVERINAWINHTRVKVIGVETVKFEYNKDSRSQPINDEKSDFTVESNRGHHWIIGLRLYIDGQFEEPPPDLLPSPPEQRKNQSSGCIIL